MIFAIETGTTVFNWGYSLWEEVEEIIELVVAGDFSRALPKFRTAWGSIPSRLYYNIPIVRTTTDSLAELLNSIVSRSFTAVPPGGYDGDGRVIPNVLHTLAKRFEERVLDKKVRTGAVLPKIRNT